MVKYIVVTDLDGSLLDPDTYSYEEVLPVIEKLKEYGIPVVFCSSKTRLEQELYRSRLELYHPFIVENGGAIYIPRGYFRNPFYNKVYRGYYVLEIGLPIDLVFERVGIVLERYRECIKTTLDMSPEDFMEITGLSRIEAILALEREYSIGFIASSREVVDRIACDVEETGLTVSTSGERIYMVSSRYDKGVAVEKLLDLYRRECGKTIAIGIGDGYNDIPLLKKSHIPILLGANRDIIAKIGREDLIVVREKGSIGWRKAIEKILPTIKG